MDTEQCPICYDTFTNKLTISCNHTFCSDCIIKWFRAGNPECPICRDAPKNEDSEDEGDNQSEVSDDTYETDMNSIVNSINNSIKTHPKSKELKEKIVECKKIRKDFKDAVKERINKAIQIELNKIPKKKKAIFEEVSQLQAEIKKKCLIDAKKVEQDTFPKKRLKFMVRNRFHKRMLGTTGLFSYELLNRSIPMPKDLRLVKQ